MKRVLFIILLLITGCQTYTEEYSREVVQRSGPLPPPTRGQPPLSSQTEPVLRVEPDVMFGLWSEETPMMTKRTQVAGAGLDGKIYVIGGFLNSVRANGTTDAVEVYDTVRGTWALTASLPRALSHSGAATVDGKLYVIGGFLDGWIPKSAVYEYDVVNDRWIERTPMPTPRGSFAIALL